eukprot:1253507-Amphidinium_carterae.1
MVLLGTSEVHHNSGITVDEGKQITWKQILMADISVRDQGRRVQLTVLSADHVHFDFIELIMPMDPQSATLLQLVQGKGASRIHSPSRASPPQHAHE